MDTVDTVSQTKIQALVAECIEVHPIDDDTIPSPAYEGMTGSEEEETPPSSNLDAKSAKTGFDEKAVAKTVRVINAVLEKDQKRMAYAIGKLLNENYESEKSRMDSKHSSKRQFAEALKKAGCKAGVSTLLQCGQLDEQKKVLTKEDIEGLSKTHHVVLLGEKDVSKKLQFAREARENAWSSNELLEKIGTSPRKPRVPSSQDSVLMQRYVRNLLSAGGTLNRVYRAIRDVSNVKDLSAVKMPAARAQELLAEMDAAQKALEPVYAKLRELAAAA